MREVAGSSPSASTKNPHFCRLCRFYLAEACQKFHFFTFSTFSLFTITYNLFSGGIAQLVRAHAWHAWGRWFEPTCLHQRRRRALLRCAAPTQIICADMSVLPDNRKIKPQQRLFFLLILLFGLPAHFLPLIRFFCFKHFHSLFHFSLLLITYFGALAQLGAHNTGSVGVRGSSPLCSTIASTSKEVLFCFVSVFYIENVEKIDKEWKKSTKNEEKILTK